MTLDEVQKALWAPLRERYPGSMVTCLISPDRDGYDLTIADRRVFLPHSLVARVRSDEAGALDEIFNIIDRSTIG